MSALEEALATQIRATCLPEPTTQLNFTKGLRDRFGAKPGRYRLWKFDFCWPELMLAVEVDGGTYSGGRHTRGAGFEGDCEKLNAATELGWKVLRYTAKTIKSGDALSQIERVIANV